jgi:FKBP-type peptidyl-prolyl cis-trans isomerase FkpA
MRSPAPRRGRMLLAWPLAVTLAAVMSVSAQQSSAPAAAATAKKAAAPDAAEAPVDKNAASYSLGLVMGGQLKETGVTAEQINTERLAQGLRDAINGKAKASDENRMQIMKLVKSAQQSAVDTNHKAAAKFLAENGKKPGVQTTASGLQYKVVKEGSGEAPKATDDAVVNYRGTLLDGTEFDSSYKSGQPATFPVGRVIPGWTEGLQLMKPGGKYILYVPPQLAYDQRAPGPIPPGSLLIFDVELLSVKKPPPPTPAPAMPQPAPATPK